MQSNTLVRVREQILSRGAKTIRGLGRVFRHIDSYDRNRKIDPNQFFVGLRQIGVTVSKDQAQQLMRYHIIIRYFDRNRDGMIDFDQFLYTIRGKPNQRRQLIIDKAFLKFDRDCSGSITPADLKGVFNTSLHPKVQNGQMTEEQVFLEFLQSFGDSNRDGTISRAQWNDYYAAVSANIDNDDHFIQLMKIAWKLD